MYNQEPVNHIRSWVEPTSHTYHIRIDRDIEEASRFQEEIIQIRQATENDRIHVYVNSNGGYLSTMGSILSALEQSPATVCCELELDAHSAASFIFLSGDEFIVSDNANMMIHELQGGASVTTSNTKRQVDHLAKQNERLVRKYYKHFLRESEIEDVLSGGEIYLNSDEIMERLQKRAEKLQVEMEEAQQQAYEEQMSAIFGEPLPKEALEPLDKETLIKVIRGELSEEEEVELFGDYMDGDCVASEDESPTQDEMNTAILDYLLEQVKSLTKHDVDVVEESGLKALKILATPSEGHGEILFFEDNYISYYDINTIDELPWDNDEDIERLDYFKIMCEDFGITYRPESCIEDLEKFHKSVVSYLKSLD